MLKTARSLFNSFLGAVSVTSIEFPATQVPSSNPNTLDDYEEGTWTPSVGRSVTFGTYTPNVLDGGAYTKIGNVVYFSGRANGSSSGASGGVWVVRGLPFPSVNNASTGRGPCLIIEDDATLSNSRIMNGTNDIQAPTFVATEVTRYFSGFYYIS